MMGFYPKFVNVVALYLQHMSSLCIDCSKMNKVSINMYKCCFQVANFEVVYFDYEIELYFEISNTDNQKPNFDDFEIQDPDSFSKTTFGLHYVHKSY